MNNKEREEENKNGHKERVEEREHLIDQDWIVLPHVVEDIKCGFPAALRRGLRGHGQGIYQ
eukprot:133895-Amorphochlora_amoeboformis.AAC.1